MSGINKVILVGRLGKDPVINGVNQKKVANFSLATSDTYKDSKTGEKKENTEWHNIVAWAPIAEVCEKYLHKGDLVYIEGKLRTRSFEKGGVTRWTTEIIVNNLQMLGKKNQKQSEQSEPDEETDDLPF